MAAVAAVDLRLLDFEIAELIEGARSQRERLEAHRLEAAEPALVRSHSA